MKLEVKLLQRSSNGTRPKHTFPTTASTMQITCPFDCERTKRGNRVCNAAILQVTIHKPRTMMWFRSNAPLNQIHEVGAATMFDGFTTMVHCFGAMLQGSGAVAQAFEALARCSETIIHDSGDPTTHNGCKTGASVGRHDALWGKLPQTRVTQAGVAHRRGC